MNGFYFSDDAVAQEFHCGEVSGTRGDLDAHLGHQLVLGGKTPERSRFVESSREWFFAIDVFAELHRTHGDRRVHVIGGADYNGVDLVSNFLLSSSRQS